MNYNEILDGLVKQAEDEKKKSGFGKALGTIGAGAGIGAGIGAGNKIRELRNDASRLKSNEQLFRSVFEDDDSVHRFKVELFDKAQAYKDLYGPNNLTQRRADLLDEASNIKKLAPSGAKGALIGAGIGTGAAAIGGLSALAKKKKQDELMEAVATIQAYEEELEKQAGPISDFGKLINPVQAVKDSKLSKELWDRVRYNNNVESYLKSEGFAKRNVDPEILGREISNRENATEYLRDALDEIDARRISRRFGAAAGIGTYALIPGEKKKEDELLEAVATIQAYEEELEKQAAPLGQIARSITDNISQSGALMGGLIGTGVAPVAGAIASLSGRKEGDAELFNEVWRQSQEIGENAYNNVLAETGDEGMAQGAWEDAEQDFLDSFDKSTPYGAIQDKASKRFKAGAGASILGGAGIGAASPAIINLLRKTAGISDELNKFKHRNLESPLMDYLNQQRAASGALTEISPKKSMLIPGALGAAAALGGGLYLANQGREEDEMNEELLEAVATIKAYEEELEKMACK